MDVSKAHMNELFMDMKEFNEDISNWDVSFDMSGESSLIGMLNQLTHLWDVSRNNS